MMWLLLLLHGLIGAGQVFENGREGAAFSTTGGRKVTNLKEISVKIRQR